MESLSSRGTVTEIRECFGQLPKLLPFGGAAGFGECEDIDSGKPWKTLEKTMENHIFWSSLWSSVRLVVSNDLDLYQFRQGDLAAGFSSGGFLGILAEKLFRFVNIGVCVCVCVRVCQNMNFVWEHSI